MENISYLLDFLQAHVWLKVVFIVGAVFIVFATFSVWDNFLYEYQDKKWCKWLFYGLAAVGGAIFAFSALCNWCVFVPSILVAVVIFWTSYKLFIVELPSLLVTLGIFMAVFLLLLTICGFGIWWVNLIGMVVTAILEAVVLLSATIAVLRRNHK